MQTIPKKVYRVTSTTVEELKVDGVWVDRNEYLGHIYNIGSCGHDTYAIEDIFYTKGEAREELKQRLQDEAKKLQDEADQLKRKANTI